MHCKNNSFLVINLIMEFSLNVFTEFSDSVTKEIKNKKGRLQDWNPESPV